MISIFLRKARVAVTPRNWILKTRLKNGAIVAGYNRAGWGGRGVYIFRDEIEPELASLEHFLRPGYVFVDIGANVGAFSMKAAKEVGESGLVIAVEPFIESARQLARNISTNRFRNCRVLNLCVAQSTGQMKFYLNANKPNSFGLIKNADDPDWLSILGVSLDDLCAWEELTRLDYLKIDAEGAESMILTGGAAAIARFRPIIQVEVTLTSSNLPQGYQRFSKPGRAPNNLFIASEQTGAIETALAQGYRIAKPPAKESA